MTKKDVSVVVVGPFIGDFETEILSFRPYAAWLYNNLTFDRFYVSGHYDRRFLYHWIDDNRYLPVDEKISDNIEAQEKYYNELVNHNKYFKLVRNIRNKVFNDSSDVKKAEIKMFTVPYTKLSDPIVASKKLFVPFDIERKDCGYILYILEPWFYKSYTVNKVSYEQGSLLHTFKEKLRVIAEAKAVVCKVSLWTIIANMMQVPVFSWSDGAIGKYKSEGDFGFRNNNMIIYYDENGKHLLRSIEYFLKKIGVK